MKILVTGGCGFLGSNLAAYAIQQKYEVIVFDNLSRQGAVNNLNWLKGLGPVQFAHADIRLRDDIDLVVREFNPEVVFHLAGQVAMTTSIENPRKDFEINAMGTLNLLESVRCHARKAIVIYSSTNKVYGDLEKYTYTETATRYECVEKPLGFDESTPLDFRSPYGCSKGAADQYMLDYARIFGLNIVVFRHSSMYGGRQFATYDQGWVGWFCKQAIETRGGRSPEPFTLSGTGKQVRDVLHADDMISLYFAAVEHVDRARGKAFNVGGGMQNSLSLLELFTLLEELNDVKLNYVRLPVRKSDQKVFVADYTKAEEILGWQPSVDKVSGIRQMLDWITDEC